MNFYLEEQSFISLLQSITNNHIQIQHAVDAMDLILQYEDLNLYIPQDFYSLPLENSCVGETIYARRNDGDTRDLLIRIQIIIEAANTIENPISETEIGLSRLKDHGTGGLITSRSFAAEAWWNESLMHVISDVDTLKIAIRQLITNKDNFTLLIEHLSSLIFEKIHFHASPIKIKNLGIDITTNTTSIIKHLSYLNDHAITDFATNTEPRTIIALAAKHGVEISPESTKTHKDHKAMKERYITIEDFDILCEWHTKFEFNKGRIHFSPWPIKITVPNNEISGKLIIGIFTEHLT